jgi:hypothetical protein
MSPARYLRLFGLLIFWGCAQRAPTLDVNQARKIANADRPQTIHVVGYYIYHFEGDELNMRPGEQTGRGIFLRLGEKFPEKIQTGSEREKFGKRFDQKRVRVTGSLKRGPFQGSMGIIDDCIYLEIAEIREDGESR